MKIDRVLEDVERRHRQQYTLAGPGRCTHCQLSWPCETTQLATIIRGLQEERDDLRTINESDEPRGLAPAVDYWRGRWAKTAVALTDALTTIDELKGKATDG